jgi:hypothetical protein
MLTEARHTGTPFQHYHHITRRTTMFLTKLTDLITPLCSNKVLVTLRRRCFFRDKISPFLTEQGCPLNAHSPEIPASDYRRRYNDPHIDEYSMRLSISIVCPCVTLFDLVYLCWRNVRISSVQEPLPHLDLSSYPVTPLWRVCSSRPQC